MSTKVVYDRCEVAWTVDRGPGHIQREPSHMRESHSAFVMTEAL